MSQISSYILQNPLELFHRFEIIEDPRINRHKRYPLINILVFTFVALLSDQHSFYQIYAFCLSNLDWFANYIDVSTGVPSHDTFRRVLSLMDPQQLEGVIINWIEDMRKKQGHKNCRVMVLDGKALKGVPWKLNEAQFYVLNAWDAEAQFFLGQLTIEEKTNEITAAPELLSKFDLENTIVTVDAIMTQANIAKTIIDAKGDYVMALKGNQGTLFKDVKLYFDSPDEGMCCWRTLEKARGRVEVRTCTKTTNVSWLDQIDRWQELKTIFKIDSEIVYEGKLTKESRYYITSLESGAKTLLELSRKHWSIENQLHRTLDVHFKEDDSSVHDRRAASNLSVLRKVALSLLRVIDPTKRLIWKLKEAAYSQSFRSRCLEGKNLSN